MIIFYQSRYLDIFKVNKLYFCNEKYLQKNGTVLFGRD